MESKNSGFSAIVVELIAGLSPESSMTVKYIVRLATSLSKSVLAIRSHIVLEPYCPYRKYMWIRLLEDENSKLQDKGGAGGIQAIYT
jgi:hypothetical protein